METVLRQGKKLLYFTGEYLGNDGKSMVFKQYGRLNYTEFTPATIDYIKENPVKWKGYEFVNSYTADILKAKERLKELIRCSKFGELEDRFKNEIIELKNLIKN